MQLTKALTAILVIALAATACSGSSDTTQSTTPRTGTPTTTVDARVETTDVTAVDAPVPPVLDPAWDIAGSDALFGSGEILTFELTLDPEDLAFLDADPTAEEYVEGSFVFNGQTVGPVGIRYKGSLGSFIECVDGPNLFEPSGAKSCSKLSMKIKINWDDPGAEFFGQRKLQFHAMNRDESMMRERLAYLMFAEMGSASPRTAPTRLIINGEYAGLFLLVENIDGRFTRDRFDDGTGNLYKEAWPFTHEGEITGEEVFIDSLRTNEDEDPSADLIRQFARDIEDISGSDDVTAVLEVLNRSTDLDDLLGFAAVDRAIINDDGPFHWYCGEGDCAPHNYFWYEEPASGKIHLIPWDLDNSLLPETARPMAVIRIADEWGQTSSDCRPFAFGPLGVRQRSASCDPLVAALVLLEDEYKQRRAEFLAGPFDPGRVAGLLDEWSSQLAPYVDEQAAALPGEPTLTRFEAAIAELLTIVSAQQEV
ncbi:MAG: hypothetical protein GY708_12590 [Actinomycetia bacterium]|nr:hypothetical protein [Actinomycetes bacterium]